MSIRVSCPKCGKRYALQDGLRGKKAKCNCGAVFRIPERDASASRPGPEVATRQVETPVPRESPGTEEESTSAPYHFFGSSTQSAACEESPPAKKVLLIVLLITLSLAAGACIIALVVWGNVKSFEGHNRAFRNAQVLGKLMIANVPVYFLTAGLFFKGWKRFWVMAGYHFIYPFRILQIGLVDFVYEYFGLKDIVLYHIHLSLSAVLLLVQWLLIRMLFLA